MLGDSLIHPGLPLLPKAFLPWYKEQGLKAQDVECCIDDRRTIIGKANNTLAHFSFPVAVIRR